MSVRKDKIQLEVEINGKKAGKSYGELIKDSRALRRELNGLVPGTQAFINKSNELKKVNSRLAEVRKATRGVVEEQSLLMKIMKQFGPIVAGAFAVRKILGLGKAIITISSNFQKAMKEVQAVSGVTGEDFDALTEKAKELGETTSKSATDAADGLKYLALAGFDVRSQLEAIEPILRLSEAGSLELGRASDLATDAMSAFGLKASDLASFLDVVSNTSTKSNTSIEQLTGGFIKSGGILKGLNTTTEEASAIFGILANRGLKAEEAGTGLNSVLINLTTGSGEAGKAMKELNLKAFDSDGKFRGISVVVNELNQKLSGLTEEQQNYYKSAIAGKRQISTLSALLSGVGEEFSDLRMELDNSKGKLEDVAKTMQDNLQGKVTQLKSSLEGLAINIGNVVIPFLTKLVSGIIVFINVLKTIPAFIRENKVAIMSLVTGIAIWNTQMILASANALRLAAVEKGRLIVTQAVTLAQNLLNKAMTANPIGLVIKAISLLVIGLGLAYNKSKTLRAGLNGLKEAGMQIFRNLLNAFQPFLDAFEAFKKGNYADALQKVGEGLVKTNPVGLLYQAGQGLGDAFNKGFNDKINEEDAEGAAAQALADKVDILNTAGVVVSGGNEGSGDTVSGGRKRANISPINKLNRSPLPSSLASGKSSENVKIDQVGIEDYIKQRQKLLEDGLDAELDIYEKAFLEGLINENVHQEQRLEAQARAIGEELELLTSLGLDETEVFRKKELEKLRIEKEMADQRIDNAKREAEFKKKIAAGQHEAVTGFLDLGIQAMKMETDERKKNANAIKAFEVGRVVANLYSEISGYFKAYAGVPGGSVISGVLSGIATLRAGLATKQILSQKFDRGGGTGEGLYYDNSGHRVAGVVHDNEYVIPKWMNLNPQLQSTIQGLETIRKRGSFAEGGLTSVNVSPSAANISNVRGGALDKLGDQFSNAINRLENLTLRANVVYSDIEATSADINNIKSLANS